MRVILEVKYDQHVFSRRRLATVRAVSVLCLKARQSGT